MKMGVSLFYAIAVTLMVFFKVGTSQDECKGITCKECISFGSNCGWCLQKNFSESRCQLSRLLKKSCQEAAYSPSSESNAAKNDRVNDGSGDEPPVQVSPQKVVLKLRARDDKLAPIRMTFRAANNFPVDLYFLFDNSKSMQPYIQDLGSLAENIGKSIGNISRNFQMGYGVFQDKVILPFTDTTPVKLANPCLSASKQDVCSPPFEFQHLLNMTKNTQLFTKKVKETNITGNLDHPEGSLDAIMQSVTCKEKIGWRSTSRKLLIFASNDRFHLAGDGRLAGIVIPNDGMCHLDKDYKYSKELEQDYPSVSQIRKVIIENEVHVIFAVKDQKELFEKLSEKVPQSVVETLAKADQSSNRNMQEIIEKKYKEMISVVEMKHTNTPGVDVRIKAKSSICETKDTNVCKGIKIGDEIEFDVEIKLTECPADMRKLQVEIFPDSLRNDKLVVDIEPICTCACEIDQSSWEVNSNSCSDGNGTLKCGVCDCNENRSGPVCECATAEETSDQSQCSRPGENSTRVCSGVGQCECKVCKCNEGYSGPYCECNDVACGLYDKQICGGIRGKCVCGECKCATGYTGSTCQCSTSNDTCKLPATGEVCNAKGICECDLCVCQKGYIGKYCEICFLCGDSVCDSMTYRQCAQCHFEKKIETCPLNCPHVEIVESLKNLEASSQCSIKQDDGCFISFIVTGTIETNVTVIIQKTKTCPEPVDILPIVAGVVGGVVAIGLLLLILWKILTTIFDRIEYSRFEEDLKKCKWAQQDNPFYKGATTTYKNPMLDTSQPLDDK
ncbi:Integrin beta-1 [Bulinus truncatus]|nr:Integrin beta-1 [Bulinus truncatus]